MKTIAILGSTGSVGTQTLDVVDRGQGWIVRGLTANSNISLLEEQIRKYKPEQAAVADPAFYHKLKTAVRDTNTKILSGREGVCQVASMEGTDRVVSALVGIAGLMPTLAAIEAGNHVALANKETLVTAGEIVMKRAKEKKVQILPVDSEHSAVFQCLQGANHPVKRIILTASGGPFLGKTKKELEGITPDQALCHPNWKMGNKVTIDSATMMNKGLEIIEAKWLFGVRPDQVDAVVHRQSVVHSMVEFTDGALLAQMGEADMRLPISYALYYPKREMLDEQPFDFISHSCLTFEQPDEETFGCLRLAKQALKMGGTMPACLNGANESAVSLFLQKKIGFLEIPEMIEETMARHQVRQNYTLEDILKTDRVAKETLRSLAEHRR